MRKLANDVGRSFKTVERIRSTVAWWEGGPVETPAGAGFPFEVYVHLRSYFEHVVEAREFLTTLLEEEPPTASGDWTWEQVELRLHEREAQQVQLGLDEEVGVEPFADDSDTDDLEEPAVTKARAAGSGTRLTTEKAQTKLLRSLLRQFDKAGNDAEAVAGPLKADLLVAIGKARETPYWLGRPPRLARRNALWLNGGLFDPVRFELTSAR